MKIRLIYCLNIRLHPSSLVGPSSIWHLPHPFLLLLTWWSLNLRSTKLLVSPASGVAMLVWASVLLLMLVLLSGRLSIPTPCLLLPLYQFCFAATTNYYKLSDLKKTRMYYLAFLEIRSLESIVCHFQPLEAALFFLADGHVLPTSVSTVISPSLALTLLSSSYVWTLVIPFGPPG